jgi:hypothetical protein
VCAIIPLSVKEKQTKEGTMIAGKRRPKDTLTLDQAKGKKPKISAVVDASMKQSFDAAVAREKKLRETRTDLMAKVKAAGIKYYRIMTRGELLIQLDAKISQETKNHVIEEAKARWKAGWKKAVANV